MLEAEHASIQRSFEVLEDDDAQNGEYIAATSGNTTSTPDDEVSLRFDTPDSDDYYLWARLYAESNSTDAIYIGIDGTWDRVFPTARDNYQWVRVEEKRNDISFNLDKGRHFIEIGHGELHARLDALWITDERNASPPED